MAAKRGVACGVLSWLAASGSCPFAIAQPLSQQDVPAPVEPSAPSFPPGWLEWSGPPECPGPEHVEARIVEWLGAPPASAAGLKAKSTVTWTGAGWQVEVVVTWSDRVGERRVRLESCRDAADLVALAVALAVNPDLDAGSAGVPTWTDETSTSPNAAGPPPDPAPPDTAPERDAASEQSSRESAAGPAALAPAPAGQWAFLLGAAAELSMGALPRVHGGVSAELGIAARRIGLWVGGRFLPPTNEVFEEAATPIRFALIAARLGADYDLFAGALRLGPRTAFELGVVEAGQAAGALAPLEDSAVWAALGLGIHAGLAAWRWLEPVGSWELTVPLTQPRFVLDDGTLVHQSTVGFRLDLGVRILL